MDRSLSKLAREQLQQVLSQRIQALYRDRLGHQPTKVTCQLFDDKLAIVIEGSVTRSEQLLLKKGQSELAEQVHSDLGEAIQPQLEQLIAEAMNVPAIDLLSDSTLETGRTGIIAVLAAVPQLASPCSKVKAVSPDSIPPR
jgi:uncharacterized protein YbcI